MKNLEQILKVSIAEMVKLELKPGDGLIYRIPVSLSQAEAARITDALRAVMPNKSGLVLVLDRGAELQKLSGVEMRIVLERARADRVNLGHLSERVIEHESESVVPADPQT